MGDKSGALKLYIFLVLWMFSSSITITIMEIVYVHFTQRRLKGSCLIKSFREKTIHLSTARHFN